MQTINPPQKTKKVLTLINETPQNYSPPGRITQLATTTLQLLLGDYAHTPHHKPVISEKITIIVE